MCHNFTTVHSLSIFHYAKSIVSKLSIDWSDGQWMRTITQWNIWFLLWKKRKSRIK